MQFITTRSCYCIGCMWSALCVQYWWVLCNSYIYNVHQCPCWLIIISFFELISSAQCTTRLRNVHACIHVPSYQSKHAYTCAYIMYVCYDNCTWPCISFPDLVGGKCRVSCQVSTLIPYLYQCRFIDVDSPGFTRRRSTLEVSTLLREMFHEYRDADNSRRNGEETVNARRERLQIMGNILS